MIALLLLACAPGPIGPETVGDPLTSGPKVTSPGVNGVEMMTYALPEDSDTTAISFVIVVPECDAIGSCRWIPDVYTYTERSRTLSPVKTDVQDTFELCYLLDGDGVWIGNSVMPDGEGEVSFRRIPWQKGGFVRLFCNVADDAVPGTYGVNLYDISLLGPYEGEFVWRDTYGNSNAWDDPVRRITVR